MCPVCGAVYHRTRTAPHACFWVHRVEEPMTQTLWPPASFTQPPRPDLCSQISSLLYCICRLCQGPSLLLQLREQFPFFFWFFPFCPGLGMEPRASRMLSMCPPRAAAPTHQHLKTKANSSAASLPFSPESRTLRGSSPSHLLLCVS